MNTNVSFPPPTLQSLRAIVKRKWELTIAAVETKAIKMFMHHHYYKDLLRVVQQCQVKIIREEVTMLCDCGCKALFLKSNWQYKNT